MEIYGCGHRVDDRDPVTYWPLLLLRLARSLLGYCLFPLGLSSYLQTLPTVVLAELRSQLQEPLARVTLPIRIAWWIVCKDIAQYHDDTIIAELEFNEYTHCVLPS